MPEQVSNEKLYERIRALEKQTEQLETALRQSEEKYRAILENLEEGYFETDIKGNLTFFNDALCRLSGFSRQELLGVNARSFASADTSEKLFQVFNKVYTTGEPVRLMDYELVRRNGEHRFVELSTYLIRDDAGLPVGFRGVSRDVTDRKQGEKELLESEERFRRLHEASFGGIGIHEKGVILDANQALSTLTGFSYEELIGMDGLLLIAENWRDYTLAKIVSGYEDPYEVRGVKKDGSQYPLEIQGKNIPYHGRMVRVTEFRDISWRKRAERDLLRMKALLSGAIEANPAGIIIADAPDGMIQVCNSAALAIRGADKAYLTDIPLSQHAVRWQYYHPDGSLYATADLPLTRALRNGEMVSNESCCIRRPDGEMRWVLGNAAPIKDDEGRIIAAVLVLPDVTEIKQMQDSQRSLEAQLHQAQKMEAVGTLAGGIAHDFNNILAAIIGYTELGILLLPENDDVRHHLQGILTACSRASGLIRQILAFSRQSEKKKQPVTMGMIVREVLKLLRASLPTTIEIQQDIADRTSKVMADPVQIHQIMMNVCTNAWHAMEKEGGIMDIQLDKISISAPCEQYPGLKPGHYLDFSVSDTGHGMTPEIMARIFDPFFTTKEPGKGTGMGLSVIHGIVKDYDGAITVVSTPGKGTIFHILLPLMEESGAETAKSVDSLLPTGTERILFVDDEPELVSLGDELLTKLGYEVTAVSESMQALVLFRENPDRFDLIITDQTMPKMTGMSLAQSILSIRKDMPIILCSGFSEMATMEKVNAIGIKAYLIKPLSVHQMARTIREVLKDASADRGEATGCPPVNQ